MRSKKNNKLVISCDGGAASGKTTGAKLISKKYRLKFLSSGILYRYAAYLLINNKSKNKFLYLKKKFKNINLKKIEKLKLHDQKISMYTSEIAKIKKIRDILKSFQVSFARNNNRCIIEGRDISTKIIPNADVKFFFTCDLANASKRRFKELKKNNPNITLSEVKKSIKMRNIKDKKRKHSPLLKVRDALEIQTGKMSIKEMVIKMSKHIDIKVKRKYGNWTTKKTKR